MLLLLLSSLFLPVSNIKHDQHQQQLQVLISSNIVAVVAAAVAASVATVVAAVVSVSFKHQTFSLRILNTLENLVT